MKKNLFLFLAVLILLFTVSCKKTEDTSATKPLSDGNSSNIGYNTELESETETLEHSSVSSSHENVFENTSDISDESIVTLTNEEKALAFIETVTQEELKTMVTAAGHAWRNYKLRIKTKDKAPSTSELTSRDLMECFAWMNRENAEKYLVTINGEKRYIVPLKDVTDFLDKHFEQYTFNPLEAPINTNPSAGDFYDEEKEVFNLLYVTAYTGVFNQIVSVSCKNHGDGCLTLITENHWQEMSDTELFIMHYGLDIRFLGDCIYFEKLYFINKTVQKP